MYRKSPLGSLLFVCLLFIILGNFLGFFISSIIQLLWVGIKLLIPVAIITWLYRSIQGKKRSYY